MNGTCITINEDTKHVNKVGVLFYVCTGITVLGVDGNNLLSICEKDVYFMSAEKGVQRSFA